MYLQFECVCKCRKLPNFCFKNEAAQIHCKSALGLRLYKLIRQVVCFSRSQ